MRPGLPDPVDPVRPARRAARARRASGSTTCTARRVRRRPAVRRRPDDGVGGAGAFFLLLDEPEVYGLPPDPVAPTTRAARRLARRRRRRRGPRRRAGGRVRRAAAVSRDKPAARQASGCSSRPRASHPTTAGRSSSRRCGSAEIAWYFFAGGLAGALGLAGPGGRAWPATSRCAARPSLVAGGRGRVCPPLLISDLGRPERFLNMLRVFRPTSPMSVGTWILAPFGAAATTAAAARPGRAGCRLLQRAAEGVAGVLGPAMSTYTAVLVGDHLDPGLARRPPRAAVRLRRLGRRQRRRARRCCSRRPPHAGAGAAPAARRPWPSRRPPSRR